MSFGLSSSVLLWSACITVIFSIKNRNTRFKIVTGAALALSCIIPINGIFLTLYIRGVLGDLSIVSQALLIIYLLNAWLGTNRQTSAASHMRLALFVVITGCWFYPTTLGLTYFDPYNLGYPSVSMHWSVLMYFLSATLLFNFYRDVQSVAIYCIASVSFCISLLESNNYWDYMIDPALTLAALTYCLAKGLIFLKSPPSLQH